MKNANMYVVANNILYSERFGFFFRNGIKKFWIAKPWLNDAVKYIKLGCAYGTDFGPAYVLIHIHNKNITYPIIEMMPYANKLAQIRTFSLDRQVGIKSLHLV
eukprot:GHVR01131604.1.p1 GENE.GHVR01131604.1~~GHVR01131604.1.p1  ORF type:complete len:103 (+),score=2.63 GHVR01131604.1:426-734(+)